MLFQTKHMLHAGNSSPSIPNRRMGGREGALPFLFAHLLPLEDCHPVECYPDSYLAHKAPRVSQCRPHPACLSGYSGAIYRTWKGLGWFLPLCLCPENTFLFSFSLPFRLSSPPGSLPPTPLSLWLSHHLHSPPLFHVLSDGHRLLP